jgi:hypothetical protein
MAARGTKCQHIETCPHNEEMPGFEDRRELCSSTPGIEKSDPESDFSEEGKSESDDS